MRKYRVALTVVAVTAALCADQVVAAAPAMRPQLTEVARQFAARLSRTFRHVMPAVRLESIRRTGQYVSTRPIVPSVPAPIIHQTDLSPFRFRLPPPQI